MFTFASRSSVPPSAARQTTANDRLKAGFSSRVWSGLIAATVAHALLFQLFPDLSASDLPTHAGEAEVIQIAQYEWPPEPEDLPRPQKPVMATAEVDPDFVPYMPGFGTTDPAHLPPPPDRLRSRDRSTPTIVPFDVAPELLNRDQVARTLKRTYPALLRDAGLGGETVMWFHIDSTGAVLGTRVFSQLGTGLP